VKSRILSGALVLSLGPFLAPPAPLAASGPPGASPVVESLTFEANGSGLSIVLTTTSPPPRFACKLPSIASGQVVIELPEATGRLQQRYAPDSPLVSEAVVDQGFNGGSGVRLRLTLADANLSGIEQRASEIVLLIESRPAVGSDLHASAPADSLIGIGDKLEISVFGHEDYSKVVEVRGDGTINYPPLGDLPVAGKSVSQIKEEIRRILGKDYLVDPQVNVEQNRWVTILGEVRTPGRYALKRNMRLIDLLAEAGGATKEAGSEILITRRLGDGQESRQIVAERERLFTRDNRDANVLLAHGDIVAVGEKEVFYIRGEVTRPGAYVIEKGMTILKAVSLAGGFTPFANRKEAELLRVASTGVNEKIVVNLKAIEDGKKQDIVLRASDTIIVPRRIF
jgi:polysaccharide biosynthesis/export protein